MTPWHEGAPSKRRIGGHFGAALGVRHSIIFGELGGGWDPCGSFDLKDNHSPTR